jgi:hypothetical protein
MMSGLGAIAARKRSEREMELIYDDQRRKK